MAFNPPLISSISAHLPVQRGCVCRSRISSTREDWLPVCRSFKRLSTPPSAAPARCRRRPAAPGGRCLTRKTTQPLLSVGCFQQGHVCWRLPHLPVQRGRVVGAVQQNQGGVWQRVPVAGAQGGARAPPLQGGLQPRAHARRERRLPLRQLQVLRPHLQGFQVTSRFNGTRHGLAAGSSMPACLHKDSSQRQHAAGHRLDIGCSTYFVPQCQKRCLGLDAPGPATASWSAPG